MKENEEYKRLNEELKGKAEDLNSKLLEKVKHNQELLDESAKEEEKNHELQDQIDALKHSFIESLDKSTVEIKTLKQELDASITKNASLQAKIDNGGESSKTECTAVPAEEGKSTTSNRGDSTSNNSNLENIRKELQIEKERS